MNLKNPNANEALDEGLIQDAAAHVELHGVDIIPSSERRSTPREVFYVFLGSQMCFGIIVIGALPIIFGLSFLASIAAITLGLALGSVLFGLLAMFGAKTGTNGPVASGAHFGVRGKSIGTVLGVLVTLGFYALTVWTGGEAVTAAATRLLGWEATPNLLFAGAGIIGFLTVAAAIFGHSLIVKTETFVSYAIGAILLLSVIVMLPNFDAGYGGTGTYALGSFWPTWFLASSICAALPISYSTILNDYTRYLPENTNTARATMAAGGGMFIGCWVAFAFAAFVTTLFKSADESFVPALMNIVPTWLVILFAFVGVVGSQPQGSLCLYSGGLGMQGLAPKSNRVIWTIIQSGAGIALVWAGIYMANMTDMLIAFLTLIECAVSPWLAINVVGFFYVTRGAYQPSHLMINNSHSRYWYSHGWNAIAVIAWIAGTIAGLLFVQTEVFSGPLGDLTGGTNSAWLIAGVVGSFVYGALQKSQG